MDMTVDSKEKIKEKDTPSHHLISYSFVLNDSSDRRYKYFVQKFQTECLELPTSWTLQLKFQQELLTGVVSCYANLKRDDSSSKSVQAFIWVKSVFESENWSDICEKGTMLPGCELQRYIPKIVEFPLLKNCEIHKANICVTICIKSCHSEKKKRLLLSMGSEDSKTFLAKI